MSEPSVVSANVSATVACAAWLVSRDAKLARAMRGEFCAEWGITREMWNAEIDSVVGYARRQGESADDYEAVRMPHGPSGTGTDGAPKCSSCDGTDSVTRFVDGVGESVLMCAGCYEAGREFPQGGATVPRAGQCWSVSPDATTQCERDHGHGGNHQCGVVYWSGAGTEGERNCGCAYETVEDGSVLRYRFFHDPDCPYAAGTEKP